MTMTDQQKETLKRFLYNEIETRNPKLLKDFEGVWATISRMVKTEGEAKAFLRAYIEGIDK